VMDFGEPQRIDQVGFDTESGEIQLVCDGRRVTPLRADITSSYERATKPKIISEVSLLAGWDRLTLNPDLALREYDYVCAIDTNTRPVRGHSVSVTTTAVCRFIRGRDVTFGLCGRGEFALGYRNVEDKPENIGWRDFIAAWKRNPKSAGKRTAVIVDSDYGNLGAFNARIRPILRDSYLPSGVTLVYASSDVGGRNTMMNVAIRLCDRTSTRMLEHLERDAAMLNEMDAVSGQPYSHWCVWKLPPTW